MVARFVLCPVCGKLTPDDKGMCYHCGSPLPSRRILLERGKVVCPNCLRVTPARFGRCIHCGAPLRGIRGLFPWVEEDVERDSRVAGFELKVGE